ncbi:MAG: hypothetical protein CBC49_007150, partial [Alphaproteobacteria bacterium TMED89]
MRHASAAAQGGGFLRGASTEPQAPEGVSICGDNIARIGNGWYVCASTADHLSFVYYGQPLMAISSTGMLWGKSAVPVAGQPGVFEPGYFGAAAKATFQSGVDDLWMNVLPPPGQPKQSVVTTSKIDLSWSVAIPKMVSDHVIAPRALEDGSCYSFVTNCIFSDYKTVKIKQNAYSMQNLFAGQRYVFRVRFVYQVGIRYFDSVFSEWPVAG